MQARISTPLGITIVVVLVLITAIFIWHAQGSIDDPTGGKGIPRTDNVMSENQKAGMEIMNKAARPDLQSATK